MQSFCSCCRPKTFHRIITARERSLRRLKVMFLQVSVCPRGGSASVHAGIADPPREQITPPCAVHAGRYGQQTGGTHPTGMHTCFNYEYIFMTNNVIWVPWFCGCSSKCVNALTTSVWSARSVHYEIVIMRDFLKVNYWNQCYFNISNLGIFGQSVVNSVGNRHTNSNRNKCSLKAVRGSAP